MSETHAIVADDYYRSTGIDLQVRGRAWGEWLEDLARYRAHYNGSVIMPLLLEQSTWALFSYRMSNAVYRSSLPYPIKRPLLILGAIGAKVNEMVTGIAIAYQADIAPGLYIGHFGPTLIGEAVIGPGCNLAHGVTIGVAGRGARRGLPHIGAHVFIGANATVAGAITVGEGAVIGANTLVTRDIPAHSTAVGVPARVMSGKGTVGMGLHQRPLRRVRRGGAAASS